MHIKSLLLENFRNYEDLNISFSSGLTIFVGENSAGKTNLIEAIYLLALTKSFRVSESEELPKWGKNYTRVMAELDAKKCEKIEVVIDKTGGTPKKSLRLDDLNIPSSKFIGNFLAVLFSPDDLNLITLSPGVRRRYFDILLSSVSPRYFEALLKYHKVVRARNKLLTDISRGISGADELYFWNKELVESGSIIINERQAGIKSLNQVLQENYDKISGGKEAFEIKYLPSFQCADNEEATSSLFHARIKNTNEIDMRYGQTSAGPHRDDYEFHLNDKNIANFASRGECRSAILAIKLAEVLFIEEKTGEKPVLLLDDVFSELDEHRRDNLLSELSGCQTIITTTDEQFVDSHRKTAKIYSVGNGELTEK